MKTQDEIIGAIENIILSSDKGEMAAFQEVAEFYELYTSDNDGFISLNNDIAFEMSLVMVSVKGAKAVQRVGAAIAEIGGQY